MASDRPTHRKAVSSPEMSAYSRIDPHPFLIANKYGLSAGPSTLKIPRLTGSPGEVTEEFEAIPLGRTLSEIGTPDVNGAELVDQDILAYLTSERTSTLCPESEKTRQNERQREDSGSGNGKKAKDLDTAKPTIDKSWEVVMKEVDSLDNGHDKGWKDDLDAILVFAGIFSAVVTAFTVESYRWLEEETEDRDTSVVLLTMIFGKLNGTSVVTPNDPKLSLGPSRSAIRINTMWFLSLIITLVDALFALLCKQWLREHSRHTHTRTPAEALALRWLRMQSLEKWRVPAILALLPMLLELAVFLFIAGVLDLLWHRNSAIFGIATGIVGSAGLVYLATTITPSLDIVRQALQVTPQLRQMRTGEDATFSPVDFITSLPPMEYTCPYKSPQAWVAFQILRIILGIPGAIRALYFLLGKEYIPPHDDPHSEDHVKGSTWSFNSTMADVSDWTSPDIEVLHRSNIELAPPFYELNAVRWLVSELRDSPTMIPHLQNILKTVPPHLVMPAIFDQPFAPLNRRWSPEDIENVLPILTKDGSARNIHRMSHNSRREITCLNRFLHCSNAVIHNSKLTPQDRHKLSDYLSNIGIQPQSGKEFTGPGWTVRNMSSFPLYLLWITFMEKEDPSSPHERNWVIMMEDLAPFIISSSPQYTLHAPTTETTSPFIGSVAGCDILFNIHNTILEKEIYRYTPGEVALRWMEAMDILRRVHQLPENHFKPIPGHFPLPLSRLEKDLNAPPVIDSEDNFKYLESFSRNWDSTTKAWRGQLVAILSNHINNYHRSSNAEAPSGHPGQLKQPPLVVSSAGWSLIVFVNDKLTKDRDLYKYLDRHNQKAWDETIGWLKFARSVSNLEKELKNRVESLGTSCTNVSSLMGFLKNHWSNAHAWDRGRLVEILSTHINNHPQIDPEYPIRTNNPKGPASVLFSSAELKFIVFVNDRLAEERLTWESLREADQGAWRNALERVRNSRGLVPGYFKPIQHHAPDLQPLQRVSEHPTGQTEEISGAGRRHRIIHFPTIVEDQERCRCVVL
ncbi:hypothetical protein PM082_009400 [Marasmius tenuissimus]|nr:hypothetical protein PM082_009400 [Marasmius tenuissimus]